MKRTRRYRAQVWGGRACVMVAVVLAAFWLFAPAFGHIVTVSRDGHWALTATPGWVEVAHSSEPSLLLIDSSKGAYPTMDGVRLIGLGASTFKTLRERSALTKRTDDEPPLMTVGRGAPRGEASGQRWYPGTKRQSPPSPPVSHTWCPMWLPAAALGAAGAITERRHRRLLKRERHGLCLTCGYDRAGIADRAAAVCPECGKRP